MFIYQANQREVNFLNSQLPAAAARV